MAAPIRSDFIYTVKVCELITHIRRFDGTESLIRDFGYIADLLGNQMGCFLFQLPGAYVTAQKHFELFCANWIQTDET